MSRGIPIAMLSLFAASTGVQAGPLYLATVTGKIDFVQDTGQGDVFADVVLVGDRFELAYIFDDIPDGEEWLTPWYDIESATLRIGTVVFQHSGIRDAIAVSNDHVSVDDSYWVGMLFTFAANEGLPYPGGIVLQDTTSTVFSDTSMPLSIDLNRFDINHFSVKWNELSIDGPSDLISGHVESLTIQLIPEPSTIVLLVCAGVAMTRRRKTATAPTTRSVSPATRLGLGTAPTIAE